jgi:hypothetical protein
MQKKQWERVGQGETALLLLCYSKRETRVEVLKRERALMVSNAERLF